jgi:hypothetical protein
VVGHEAIGQDPYREALASQLQDTLEGLVVRVLAEDTNPRIGAVEDMKNDSADGIAGCSAHIGILAWPGTLVN